MKFLCGTDTYWFGIFVLAEIRPGSEISIQEIQENLKNLYEYNVMLREKLVSTRSTIHDLKSNASALSSDDRPQ